MDNINRKLRQMRRFKVVFKRQQKRAKTPSREPSVTFSSTQTSSFVCPICSVEKTNAEIQTTETDPKELSTCDAGVQANITPTRIPRLQGTKYSSSSESSLASTPISHDAACQTQEREDSSSDFEKFSKENSLRPSSANPTLNSSQSTGACHNKYRPSSSHNSTSVLKDKNIRCFKSLTLQNKSSGAISMFKSKNKDNAPRESNKWADDKAAENTDSEKSPDSLKDGLYGKNKVFTRRSSSSSSGIPVHVKLRTLQSPNIYRNRPLQDDLLAAGFLSSANSSGASSPSGDGRRGSSGDESDSPFWNAGERYSVLSETYTLEGAGDFLENDQTTSSEVETSKTDITSPGSGSGIRPPKVFLTEKK